MFIPDTHHHLGMAGLAARTMTTTTALTAVGPTSRKVVGTVRGETTEVLHIEYSNRDFVVITQVGKIGTVFDVQKKAFSARAVFGQRGSDIMHIYVRMVASLVAPTSQKPLTVCLAIKSPSMDDGDDLRALLNRLGSK